MGLPAHQPAFSANDYLAWESTFARGESVTLASFKLVITEGQMFAEVDEV